MDRRSRTADALCATPPLAIVPMFDLPTPITGKLVGAAVSSKPGSATWIPFTGDAVPALKAALNLLGYAGGIPRPPLRPVSEQVVDVLRSQLEALGLVERVVA